MSAMKEIESSKRTTRLAGVRRLVPIYAVTLGMFAMLQLSFPDTGSSLDPKPGQTCTRTVHGRYYGPDCSMYYEQILAQEQEQTPDGSIP